MPMEAEDIAALALAIKNLQPAAQVNAAAVKLPSFWQGNPEVWFKQAESVFSTRNPAITTQQTKFDYVIQALDNNTADRVQNIILNPPDAPYDKLKAALVSAFGKTQAEKDQDLLNLNGLGDRKPSELLQHMKNLNVDPATLFKALFLAQLPSDVRRILATSEKTDIGDLAAEADRITEISKLTQENQVNATSSVRGSSHRQAPGDFRTGAGGARTRKPLTTWTTTPGMCDYHSTFGDQARKCIPPCKFHTVSGNGPTGRR